MTLYFPVEVSTHSFKLLEHYQLHIWKMFLLPISSLVITLAKQENLRTLYRCKHRLSDITGDHG